MDLIEKLLARFPLLAQDEHVACWLQANYNAGLRQNTLLKYAYGLTDYLRFCQTLDIDHVHATLEHVMRYKRYLQSRVWHRGASAREGLAATTIRQRMVVLKLYYTHLQADGVRDSVPLRPRSNAYDHERFYASSIVQSDASDPIWIPTEMEWAAIVAKMAGSVRNLLMLRLAYEGALRREELCSLQVRDLDQARCMLTVRKETTKNRLQRTVPYSAETRELCAQYLAAQPSPLGQRDQLFRSESPRNAGKPISIWSWSKIVRSVGLRVGLPDFSTHTIRHLRITHWAEAGIELLTVAKLAGHKYPQTTMRYIHLRPEQLAEKLVAAMNLVYGKFFSGSPLRTL